MLSHQNCRRRFLLLTLLNQYFKNHLIKSQPTDEEFKMAIYLHQQIKDPSNGFLVLHLT